MHEPQRGINPEVPRPKTDIAPAKIVLTQNFTTLQELSRLPNAHASIFEPANRALEDSMAQRAQGAEVPYTAQLSLSGDEAGIEYRGKHDSHMLRKPLSEVIMHIDKTGVIDEQTLPLLVDFYAAASGIINSSLVDIDAHRMEFNTASNILDALHEVIRGVDSELFETHFKDQADLLNRRRAEVLGGNAKAPRMETHGEQVGKTQPGFKLEEMEEGIIRAVKEHLPTSRPQEGQADEFWGNTTLFTDRGLRLGELNVGALTGTDQDKFRSITYSRPILNEEGTEVGVWKKQGWYKGDETVSNDFLETISTKSDYESVEVYIDKETKGGVKQLGRKASITAENGSRKTFDENIYYQFGRDGIVLRNYNNNLSNYGLHLQTNVDPSLRSVEADREPKQSAGDIGGVVTSDEATLAETAKPELPATPSQPSWRREAPTIIPPESSSTVPITAEAASPELVDPSTLDTQPLLSLGIETLTKGAPKGFQDVERTRAVAAAMLQRATELKALPDGNPERTGYVGLYTIANHILDKLESEIGTTPTSEAPATAPSQPTWRRKAPTTVVPEPEASAATPTSPSWRRGVSTTVPSEPVPAEPMAAEAAPSEPIKTARDIAYERMKENLTTYRREAAIETYERNKGIRASLIDHARDHIRTADPRIEDIVKADAERILTAGLHDSIEIMRESGDYTEEQLGQFKRDVEHYMQHGKFPETPVTNPEPELPKSTSTPPAPEPETSTAVPTSPSWRRAAPTPLVPEPVAPIPATPAIPAPTPESPKVESQPARPAFSLERSTGIPLIDEMARTLGETGHFERELNIGEMKVVVRSMVEGLLAERNDITAELPEDFDLSIQNTRSGPEAIIDVRGIKVSAQIFKAPVTVQIGCTLGNKEGDLNSLESRGKLKLDGDGRGQGTALTVALQTVKTLKRRDVKKEAEERLANPDQEILNVLNKKLKVAGVTVQEDGISLQFTPDGKLSVKLDGQALT